MPLTPGFEVAVLLGVVLVSLAVVGWPSRSTPTCRRCRADLKPVLSNETPRCACGAYVGERGAVRWRGRRRSRRLALIGLALVGLAGGLRAWSGHRSADDLRWRDVRSTEVLLATIEAPTDRATDRSRSIAWSELARRAARTETSVKVVRRVLRVLDTAADSPDADAIGAFVNRLEFHGRLRDHSPRSLVRTSGGSRNPLFTVRIPAEGEHQLVVDLSLALVHLTICDAVLETDCTVADLNHFGEGAPRVNARFIQRVSAMPPDQLTRRGPPPRRPPPLPESGPELGTNHDTEGRLMIIRSTVGAVVGAMAGSALFSSSFGTSAIWALCGIVVAAAFVSRTRSHDGGGRPRRARCRHTLALGVSERCPECGARLDLAEAVRRDRR